MKEFHRRDFANRTGLAQAWTVKSADRLFTSYPTCGASSQISSGAKSQAGVASFVCDSTWKLGRTLMRHCRNRRKCSGGFGPCARRTSSTSLALALSFFRLFMVLLHSEVTMSCVDSCMMSPASKSACDSCIT